MTLWPVSAGPEVLPRHLRQIGEASILPSDRRLSNRHRDGPKSELGLQVDGPEGEGGRLRRELRRQRPRPRTDGATHAIVSGTSLRSSIKYPWSNAAFSIPFSTADALPRRLSFSHGPDRADFDSA